MNIFQTQLVVTVILSVVVSSINIVKAEQKTNIEQSQVTEVISVTATKQAVLLVDTADSVSSVLQQEIEDIAPQHINQVLARTPGTWISRGNGQEHLTAIRSPVLTGAGSCGAFFMGLDAINIRAPGFCNANQLFDINYEQAAAVDVLRSPASTLYGANALHGVINVISPDAFSHRNNNVDLTIGAYEFARLTNALGKQTGNNSAWLNLVNISNENGYQSDSGYDQQKMTHIYQISKNDWSNKTVVDLSNLHQQTAGFIEGFESYKDNSLRRINPNPEAFRQSKSLRAYSAFDIQLEVGTLQLKPYLRANKMAFLQHYLPWQALEENSHKSAGIQTKLSYSLANAELISGVDFDYTKGSLVETQENDFSPSIPSGIHYDYDVIASQLALYTQALWKIDNWRLTAGARVERNHYNYDNKAQGQSACANSVSLCRFSRPDDQSRSFTALSPSVNAQYLINDQSSWYIKYSQGFRAPQVTELFRLQNNQQVADIKNESIDAIESGVRWRNASSNLHVAVYYMQKEDVIFQDSNRQNITGGETRHQGVELELGHAFTKRLSLKGHISYAQHTYTNNFELLNARIEGNDIDTAPKWMSQVNLKYRANENLTASLNWQFLDKYYLDPQNTATYDGHQLLDLRVNYSITANVKVSFQLLNLTNSDYAERADLSFGNYRYFVGQPRRAFVNIKWNY